MHILDTAVLFAHTVAYWCILMINHDTSLIHLRVYAAYIYHIVCECIRYDIYIYRTNVRNDRKFALL